MAAMCGWFSAARNFRFALESRHSSAISRERLRQDLDGNVAIEPCVACPIHFAHPAGPEG
jgi:hypothetical protein